MIWYLATPYSKYEGGIDAAFRMAACNAAVLAQAGVSVFSPITHGHPLSVYGRVDPLDHDFWLNLDKPFMRAAHGLIVLEADGWQDSYGVKEEIKAFASMGKRVVFMRPGIVPSEVNE